MTLGNAAKAELRLIVWCCSCGHQVEPDPAEAAQQCGADPPVLDWRERQVLEVRRPAGRFCREWDQAVTVDRGTKAHVEKQLIGPAWVEVRPLYRCHTVAGRALLASGGPLEPRSAALRASRSIALVYTQGLSCVDVRDARDRSRAAAGAFSEIDSSHSS